MFRHPTSLAFIELREYLGCSPSYFSGVDWIEWYICGNPGVLSPNTTKCNAIFIKK